MQTEGLASADFDEQEPTTVDTVSDGRLDHLRSCEGSAEAAADRPPDELPEPMGELPGYAFLRPLGKGGMAECHLAERRGAAGVSVRCVVKTILPVHRGREGYRERFLGEARILSHLQHPNLVSILDLGQVDQRLFLVMEWVDGLDALELMRRLRKRDAELPLRYVLAITREVLQGLHHVHGATGDDGGPLGLIHRDLTPSNILISRQGAVKLTDFGVAQAPELTREDRPGGLIGKLHYLAPELFGEGEASVASDLWSLGVTLYELLNVRPLFSRRLEPEEVRDAIVAFDIDALLQDDLTIPDGLEDILVRCLARDPADRFGSALEFLEAVDDYMAEAGLRVVGPQLGEYVGRVLADSEPGERRAIGRRRQEGV